MAYIVLVLTQYQHSHYIPLLSKPVTRQARATIPKHFRPLSNVCHNNTTIGNVST
jgi:hypothetical protein